MCARSYLADCIHRKIEQQVAAMDRLRLHRFKEAFDFPGNLNHLDVQSQRIAVRTRALLTKDGAIFLVIDQVSLWSGPGIVRPLQDDGNHCLSHLDDADDAVYRFTFLPVIALTSV